jgi:hypothetical protein
MDELLDFIFGLVLIVWYFVCLKLISKFSGWERLASKYALEGKFVCYFMLDSQKACERGLI